MRVKASTPLSSAKTSNSTIYWKAQLQNDDLPSPIFIYTNLRMHVSL